MEVEKPPQMNQKSRGFGKVQSGCGEGEEIRVSGVIELTLIAPEESVITWTARKMRQGAGVQIIAVFHQVPILSLCKCAQLC